MILHLKCLGRQEGLKGDKKKDMPIYHLPCLDSIAKKSRNQNKTTRKEEMCLCTIYTC